MKAGDRVRVRCLGTTQGMLIGPSYLSIRRAGAEGTVLGYVAGHGGDVWWVQQDDGVAAYTITELEEEKTA